MHPIIQAEVDEFRKMIHGRHGHKDTLVHEDEFFYGIQSMESFLSAALHRAIEKAGKEMVGEVKNGDIISVLMGAPKTLSSMIEDERNTGYNTHRSLALSKLDTIINFKE